MSSPNENTQRPGPKAAPVEIKVVKDVGAFDISTFSVEERKLFFDKLREQLPEIPKPLFDGLIDAYEESVIMANKYIKPKIKELLLRKLVQLSQRHMVVVPIIAPMLQQIKHGRATNELITGGAGSTSSHRLRPQRKPTFSNTKLQDIPPSALKIRFDTVVLTVSTDGLEYFAPPNEELIVVGMVVNPYCSELHLVKNGALVPAARNGNFAGDSTDVQKLLTHGTYSAKDISSACDPILFQRPSYRLPPSISDTGAAAVVMFDRATDDHLIGLMSTVYDYIVGYTQYHNSVMAAAWVYHNVAAAVAAIAEDVASLATIDIALPPAPIVKNYDKILNYLETLQPVRYTRRSWLSILADVYGYGVATLFNNARIAGIDSKEVTTAAVKIKERIARREYLAESAAKQLAERNKLNVYRAVIEQKLGPKRLAEVDALIAIKPTAVMRAEGVLDLLKPAERRPIELEYQRREKYLEAVLNNKCPHVKIHRRFRHAISDEDTRWLYRELRNYFKNPGATAEMIMCNNCGFEIMCPHVRDFTELELAGEFHAKIQARLSKYVDRNVVRDNYFCKICGEVISTFDEFSHDVDAAAVPTTGAMFMNEELKNFMWSEMISVVKYLKFDRVINVSHLVSAMRDACYPYVFEIEKQILKSKTNSADEIKAKKRLYVTIYAFAYIIHLIMSKSNSTGRAAVKVSFRDFKPKPGANYIVELIKHSLELILLSRNVVIREIPGMNADVIKGALIEAYKSLQKSSTKLEVDSESPEDILATLLIDPVYLYLFNMHILDEFITAGRKSAVSPHEIVDKLDDIMGETVQRLEKADAIFAKAVAPDITRWNPAALDKLPDFTRGGLAKWSNIRAARQALVARSFELFFQKLKARTFTEYVYVDAGDIDIRFNKPHEEHYNKYISLRKKEQNYLDHKLGRYARSYLHYPTQITRRWGAPNAKLSRIYDEDGNPHNFAIYVMSDGSEKNIKDFIAAVEKRQPIAGQIVDKKCTICGILRSSTNALSEDRIKDALSARASIDNFFRFYEHRCPKGNLHETVDSKCTKCGMDQRFLSDNTSKPAIAYYKQYSRVYVVEKAEFSTIRFTTTPAAPVDKKSYDDLQKWSSNFNLVLDLANKLKINHRLLSALGSPNGIDHAEITNGQYIPPEAESRYDTRIYMIDTHIKNLITEYNQIRYFHRLMKPPGELSQLIDRSGISKHRIAELSKLLPDIYNDYSDKFVYMQRHKKPRETVEFCVQMFCEKCLMLWNDTEKETEKLRHDFVEYFVKKTLRDEELITKPGYFNWSLLYGDKDKGIIDSNYNPNIEDETDRAFDETAEAVDDFGDTATPMVAADFDVEVDPDADPMDDESNDINDWKVGEDYGLD